jgi:hypothetical protein
MVSPHITVPGLVDSMRVDSAQVVQSAGVSASSEYSPNPEPPTPGRREFQNEQIVQTAEKNHTR